jgi:hypothetical protein
MKILNVLFRVDLVTGGIVAAPLLCSSFARAWLASVPFTCRSSGSPGWCGQSWTLSLLTRGSPTKQKASGMKTRQVKSSIDGMYLKDVP